MNSAYCVWLTTEFLLYVLYNSYNKTVIISVNNINRVVFVVGMQWDRD
jgi:hypothetical protein